MNVAKATRMKARDAQEQVDQCDSTMKKHKRSDGQSEVDETETPNKKRKKNPPSPAVSTKQRSGQKKSKRKESSSILMPLRISQTKAREYTATFTNMGLFNKLPGELRNKIYALVLDSPIKTPLKMLLSCKIEDIKVQPVPRTLPSDNLRLPHRRMDPRYNLHLQPGYQRKVTAVSMRISTHPLALLGTCSQIRKEASVFYQNGSFTRYLIERYKEAFGIHMIRYSLFQMPLHDINETRTGLMITAELDLQHHPSRYNDKEAFDNPSLKLKLEYDTSLPIQGEMQSLLADLVE